MPLDQLLQNYTASCIMKESTTENVLWAFPHLKPRQFQLFALMSFLAAKGALEGLCWGKHWGSLSPSSCFLSLISALGAFVRLGSVFGVGCCCWQLCCLLGEFCALTPPECWSKPWLLLFSEFLLLLPHLPLPGWACPCPQLSSGPVFSLPMLL